jgi:hypothetical protein
MSFPISFGIKRNEPKVDNLLEETVPWWDCTGYQTNAYHTTDDVVFLRLRNSMKCNENKNGFNHA